MRLLRNYMRAQHTSMKNEICNVDMWTQCDNTKCGNAHWPLSPSLHMISCNYRVLSSQGGVQHSLICSGQWAMTFHPICQEDPSSIFSLQSSCRLWAHSQKGQWSAVTDWFNWHKTAVNSLWMHLWQTLNAVNARICLMQLPNIRINKFSVLHQIQLGLPYKIRTLTPGMEFSEVQWKVSASKAGLLV